MADWRLSDRRVPLDVIRRALALGPLASRSPVESMTHSASAVLAPLYEHEDDVWVVLTRRAWHLRAHRGEVSFPGGRQEPDESLWDTAVREAWEEIDLDRGSVERIGELDHLSTVTSRSFIVPYVGVLPGRPMLTANEHEVDAILHVPLVRAARSRHLPPGALGMGRRRAPHPLLRAGGRHPVGRHRLHARRSPDPDHRRGGPHPLSLGADQLPAERRDDDQPNCTGTAVASQTDPSFAVRV